MRWNGDWWAFLHRWVDARGVPAQGLQVRVGKARQLQILLCLQKVDECCHQTSRRIALEQDDAGEHTELNVKALVHVQLASQILDLIHRKLKARWECKTNCEGWFWESTFLGSVLAMFLRAMRAATWTLKGRAWAARLWVMGRIFMIGLRLRAWPPLPITFSNRMISSMSFSAPKGGQVAWLRRSWINCWGKREMDASFCCIYCICR